MEQLPQRAPTSLTSLWDGYWRDTTIFSSEAKFSVRVLDPIPKKTLLRSMVAYTVFNPMKEVVLQCQAVGPLVLDELRQQVLKCVHDDDDILTQFHGPEEIAEALAKAESFDKVVNIIKRLDEEEDYPLWEDPPNSSE